jgi:transcriptional regulator with XRE-family HTH domain
MPAPNALGDFLRASRARVTPADAGLAPGRRRRVTGLRREELAMLAGISTAYLQRLEQGHDKHPSPEVIDSLAQALRMDLKSRAYLQELANPVRRRADSTPREAAPEDIISLVASLPIPAVVLNRYQDVLAANHIAAALSPGFAVGVNTCRWRFTDPAAHDVYANWEEATAIAVGGLRELSATDPDDPRLAEMVAELSAASSRFRELWDLVEVGYRPGVSCFRHPEVGDVQLSRSKLDIPHSLGQHVLMFHPDPGSESARAVDRLRGKLQAQ